MVVEGIPYKIYVVGGVSCYKIKVPYTREIGVKMNSIFANIDLFLGIRFRKSVSTSPGMVSCRRTKLLITREKVHNILYNEKFNKEFEKKLV